MRIDAKHVFGIAKGMGNPSPLAATIPETVYICFQLTFAIITPALIAGELSTFYLIYYFYNISAEEAYWTLPSYF